MIPLLENFHSKIMQGTNETRAPKNLEIVTVGSLLCDRRILPCINVQLTIIFISHIMLEFRETKKSLEAQKT